MFLKKLKIGNLVLENNIILAPMAGVQICHLEKYVRNMAILDWYVMKW